jgi:general secretion pathway protein F
MPVFEYKGLDGAGKAIEGVVDADNAKAARSRLRKQRLFVTEIKAQSAKATRGEGLNVQIDLSKYLQFVTKRDISMVTTQLSTLVGAHIPIAEALAALVDQAEKAKLKIILSRVKERVNEGAGLADALKDHPSVFDELYIQMVRAGEKSGALDVVLKRLAKFSDKAVKLQTQIVSAMAYPILMGMIGTGILAMLFVFVIPRIRSIFETLPGGEESLPLISKIVFGMGDVLVGWWWLGPFFVVPTVWGFRFWLKTESGRRRWDLLMLQLPVIGKLNRQVSISRFCRTLSTLLLSGVPIIAALRIVEDVVGNVILAEAIANATTNIQEGQSIAAPLKSSGQFPPLVTHMVAIGERTGELEQMLTSVRTPTRNRSRLRWGP